MDYYQAVDSGVQIISSIASNVSSNSTNPQWNMLGQLDPQYFGFLGAAFAISISVVGAAWYILIFII